MRSRLAWLLVALPSIASCDADFAPDAGTQASLADAQGDLADLSLIEADLAPAPPPHCSNKVMDADEVDVDCGGNCPGCGLWSACGESVDCASQRCLGDRCVPIPTDRPRPIGFNAAIHYPLGGRIPAAMLVGDLNLDGAPDAVLLVSEMYTEGNGIFALLGRGDGTFSPGVFSFAFPASPHEPLRAAALGDFDRDGRLDLALASESATSLLRGGGDGSFALTLQMTRSDTAIVAADFNGDGLLDLMVGPRMHSRVDLLAGRGDGTFASALSYPTSEPIFTLSAPDLNGDRRRDVLSSGLGQTQPWLQLQDGSLAAGLPFEIRDEARAMAVVDLDGDGVRDVVNSGLIRLVPLANGIKVRRGLDGRSFNAPDVFQRGSDPKAPVAADFDNDGIVDLALSDPPENALVILRGLGSGRLDDGTRWRFESGFGWHVVADFNRDGWPDLVLTRYADRAITVLVNSAGH